MADLLSRLDELLKTTEDNIKAIEQFSKTAQELLAKKKHSGKQQSGKQQSGKQQSGGDASAKKSKKADKKALKQKKYEEKMRKKKEAEAKAKPGGGKKKKKQAFATEPKKVRKAQAPDETKATLKEPMAAKYDPTEVECHWDQWWRAKGYYAPEMGSPKEKFVMMIPPPNVTGSLHLGHALMAAIEDAITRYWRMKGKNCLWLPGTDHAGIATQTVVERMLQREGKTRHNLGRENFLKKVWAWKEEHGGKICSQLKKLGCSVDWDREVFTMDAKLERAVVEAFIRMFERNKIYRSRRLCNWSCHLGSAISNAEVETTVITEPTMLTIPGYDKKIKFGVLHSFAYKVKGMNDEIVVATTRLETMLGDTAVAIHPDDKRYKKFHGKFVEHPFFPDRKMPIVCDSELVKMDFGTGCVKVTPSHDENDFKCGQRHDLEMITIFDEAGCINELGGKFKGIKRFDARYAVMEELKKLGAFKGETPNEMSIPFCSRSKDVIEPLPLPQWWVDCNEMAKRSTDAVRKGELQIIGHRGKETFFDYLDNIRPWCISRQLWWGHRVPAYQICVDGKLLDGDNTENWVAAKSEAEAIQKAKKKFPGKKITVQQDEDVLDTWFSSGLFPFSTLGWPDDTADFREFFPNHLLETGHDIIFFWVARMVMMSLDLTDQLPFTQVFLHPMVKDRKGGKMSKSKGNVIDPLHIINGAGLDTLVNELHKGNLKDEDAKAGEVEKRDEFPDGIPPCGADALRFGLLDYLGQGRSINLDVGRVVGWRKFGNKMWQAQSFVNMMLGSCREEGWTPKYNVDTIASALTRPEDKWILNKLNECIAIMDEKAALYEFADVTRAFYDFFFNTLCAIYVESVKPIFPREGRGDPATQEVVLSLLTIMLETSYRALHPLMPFITEELWQRIPGDKGAAACIVAKYPEARKDWECTDFDKDIDFVLKIVESLRSTRDSLHLTRERPLAFLTHDRDIDHHFLELISTLASVGVTSILKPDDNRLENCLKETISKSTDVYVEIANIDFTTEIKKLKKLIGKKEGAIQGVERKLSNPHFLKKAKQEVVDKENAKLEDYKAELAKLTESVAKYERMKK